MLGNIGSIRRRGLVGYDGSGNKLMGMMDDLTMTIVGGKLSQVTEAANTEYGYKGDSSSFQYDAYGRLTQAYGRGFDHIEYNSIGQTSLIVTTDNDSIQFYYDAEGIKWKQVTKTTTETEEKVYLMGLEVVNGNFETLQNANGRLTFDAEGKPEQYEFVIRDHLGNNRVYFTDQNDNGIVDFTNVEVLQTLSFYPFGMEIEGFDGLDNINPAQKYKYNGKEELLGGMYDYGARLYDPFSGRWTSVDPLVEKFYGWSPFNYVYNNPIVFVDPDGRSPDNYVFTEEGKFKEVEENDEPDQLVIENQKTGDRQDYDFHDSKTDIASIKSNMKKFGSAFKHIKFVNVLSDKKIDGMMKESGVKAKGFIGRIFKLLTESNGGKLDFSTYHLSRVLGENGQQSTWDYESEISKDKGPLFIVGNQKTAYNLFDAGNWLWGNAVNRLGGSLKSALIGARGFNSNDTNADIRAIRTGHLYKSGYRETTSCPNECR